MAVITEVWMAGLGANQVIMKLGHIIQPKQCHHNTSQVYPISWIQLHLIGLRYDWIIKHITELFLNHKIILCTLQKWKYIVQSIVAHILVHFYMSYNHNWYNKSYLGVRSPLNCNIFCNIFFIFLNSSLFPDHKTYSWNCGNMLP